MSASAKKAIPVEPEEMGWKTLKIKEFAHTTSGGTPKSTIAKYYGGDIPWVKSGDLNDGQLHECESTITELGLQNSSAKIFKPGTVLIALYGATIGRLALLQFEAATNQAVCGITLPDDVDNKYLFYFLLSIRKKLIDQGKGGAQPNISQHVVREIEVPLALFEQQKQIVAKIEELFSHIDAGIDALKQSKQLLKQYRQSVLKAAVTGELSKEWREQNAAQGCANVAKGQEPEATKVKLEPASKLLERILQERRQKWEAQQMGQFKAKGKVPKDEGWKGKYVEPSSLQVEPKECIPGNWCWVSIGQVFDVFVGATPSRKEPSYWGGDINWVSSGEVAFSRITDTKEKITQSGLANTSTEVHPPGTVMLGMIGEGKTRGQAAILNIYAAHNQNTAAIQKIIPEQSEGFLYLYLMQQYEVTRKRGSGNNQKALNKTRVQEINFPLAPLEEQKVICDEIESKLSAVEEMEKSIDLELKRSERLKQSVLQSAFGGELT